MHATKIWATNANATEKNHDADADANATPTATKITTNATRDRPTRLQCKKDLGNKD